MFHFSKFTAGTQILILIFIGLIVYFQSIRNNFINDDFFQIVDNPQIKSISNIPRFFSGSTYFRPETGESYGLYYRPLMLSLYTIIYSIVGADPLYFHLVQIFFHIGNAILILLIYRKLLGQSEVKPENLAMRSLRSLYPSPAFGMTINIIAFFASILFLIHPITTETVVYIADLQDVLFLFFGLLALWFVIAKGVITHISKVFVGILLILSLFSKETGILFIPLITLYVYLFNRIEWKRFLVLGFLVFGIFAFFRWGVAGSHITDEKWTPISQTPLPGRLLNTPMIWFSFFSLFIWPDNLSLNQMWLVKSVTSWQFVVPLLGLVIISAGLWFLGSKMRQKKALGKIFLFFLVWVLMGLFMHSQIIPLNATLTTRWYYFPFIGLLGMLSIIILNLSRLAGKVRNDKIIVIILIFILTALSIRTIFRTFDWKDEETLFIRDIKASGGNYYLENSLAGIYIGKNQYVLAKPLVESSVRQFPYFGNLNNMAMVFINEGKLDEADEYFIKAMQAKGSYMVYQNYANFLIFIKKDKEKARTFIDLALQYYPKSEKLKDLRQKTESL